MKDIVAIDWGVKNVGVTIFKDGEYTSKLAAPGEIKQWLRAVIKDFDVIVVEGFNPNSHQAYISNKHTVEMNVTIGELHQIALDNDVEMVFRNSSEILNKNKDNGKFNINFLDHHIGMRNVDYENNHIRDSVMHMLQYQALQEPKINKKEFIIKRNKGE